MKNTYNIMRRIIVMMVFALSLTTAQGQALRTGYFTDGNVLRYRLNPALMSTRGHVSIPVLGNINFETMGNVGMGNFLYNSTLNSDKLVTFMHPTVKTDEFLNSLESDNRILMNLDITLLSTAFHAWGGFNSVDLTVRSMAGVSLPYDMLRFMKVSGNGDYNFSDVNIHTRNFADLSLGHSRKISESLTLGARVKFLFGLGYADATFDNMSIKASADRWEIMARGDADIALGGAFKHSKEKSVNGKTMIDGYEDAAAGLHGFGAGVDLGAVYEFKKGALKGLSLSASVNDLGFISWSKSAHATISPEAPYLFNGFDNMAIHGSNNTLDDQWEGMRDDLEDFFALEDKGTRSVTESIGAKVNVGAEYETPFYRRLSVGILYTGCFDGSYTYNQGMLAINISPLNVLDFAVSGRVGTYGAGFGAMANIHCQGFSFFIGTDCFMNKVGKQFIPLENMNANVSFGINIALGKAKDKARKAAKDTVKPAVNSAVKRSTNDADKKAAKGTVKPAVNSANKETEKKQ